MATGTRGRLGSGKASGKHWGMGSRQRRGGRRTVGGVVSHSRKSRGQVGNERTGLPDLKLWTLSEVTSHFSWHVITEKGVGKSTGSDVTQTWVQVLFMAL